MWSGMNRRKFPRADYKCLINIKRRGVSKSISAHTENIGAGGICVIIKERLDLFQDIAITLFLDDEKNPVKCSGQVVWVVKKRPEGQEAGCSYDTGIEFVKICEKSRERISKIIGAILKKQVPST